MFTAKLGGLDDMKLSLITILCVIISQTDGQDRDFKAVEGASCFVGDPIWYPAPDDRHDFLYCHSATRIFTRQRCSTSFNGNRKVFDFIAQQCVVSTSDENDLGLFNESNLLSDSPDSLFGAGPRTGDPCRLDSDCPQNGQCSPKGICECRKSYMHLYRLCWQSLEPTMGPCSIDEQCSVVWPGAECHRGSCACPKGTVPVNTSGGIMCTLRDKCPLGGPSLMVSEPVDGSDPCQSCNEANYLSSPNAFLYECIYGTGFSRPICCPNKAFTCMQPQLAGNGQLNETRFTYNSLSDECHEFEFYGGSMINSNVFQTKAQCENYCRRGCLRGNPEVKDGRTISCADDNQCTTGYRCYRRDGIEAGLCCPSADSLCNPYGAVDSIENGKSQVNDAAPIKEFDSGQEPERSIAIYYPAVRYYYSGSEKQCKTFLYRGVGGNFNNFLTMDQCQNFCATAVCPLGQKAAINSRTNRWVRCRQDDQCPTEFTCLNGSCCSGGQKPKKAASDMQIVGLAEQVCPRGARIVLRENGGVIFCDPSHPCPEDAFCRLSTTAIHGEGICCAGHLIEFQPPKCPGNGSIPMAAGKFQAVTCSLGQQTGCPPPHTCAYSSINATDGLCCMVPPEAVVCPSGMEKVMTEDGRFHQQCSPLHLTTCPEGGACVFNEAYGVYYCCKPVARDCPDGRFPFADLYNNRALSCTSSCPQGYTCLDSPGAPGKRTCCSEHPLVRHCLIGKALTNHAGVPYSCSPNSRCPPGYYCVSTSVEGNVCCPRADQVCSQAADFGTACTSGLEAVSYYFDPSLRSCKPFLYRGCGGNDNRFSDPDQCQAFCHLSTICQHGLPAMSDDGALIRQQSDGTLMCSKSAACPDGYDCIQTPRNRSYCCPVPEIVCKQPKASGLPCDDINREMSEYQRTWYFDVASKQCQVMTYYGCDGNANRFHTLDVCEQFCYPALCPTGGNPQLGDRGMQQCLKDQDCRSGYKCISSKSGAEGPSICCPEAETICSNPIEKGEACGAAELRYAYNQTSGRCEQFIYLGCKGNDNNFQTMEICNKTCASVGVDSNTPEKVCGETWRSGVPVPLKRCNISDDCPLLYRCIYPEKRQLEQGYCCPMPKQKCVAQPPLWRSQKFPSNDQCSVRLPNSCPTNYSCQWTEEGFKKCCEDPDINRVCPNSPVRGRVGQHLLIRCDDSDDQCPSGYSCIYNRQFGQFFCCLESDRQPVTYPRSLAPPRPDTGLDCPGGASPYMDPYLHTVRVCSPYLRFSCPSNYECIYNVRAARYQCCLLEEPAVSGREWAYRLACPTGLTPFFHSDDRPIICQPTSPGGSSCPSPSVCQYSPLYWQFICCVVDGQMTNSKNSSEAGPNSRNQEAGRPKCTTDLDCQGLPGTICRDSTCTCPRLTLYYTCVDECPPNYIRTPDDRCQLPMFDYHYYRQVAGNTRRYHNGRYHR